MTEILPKPDRTRRSPIVLLDGAMGTELARLGVATAGPAWSASAVTTHPEAIRKLHRAYAESGATVHTAATFRTTRWGVGDRARALTHEAVQLARAAVPADHRVAGSLAPARDCYRLADRPPDDVAHREHTEHARHLADAAVDLVLCETFADPGETRIAVEAALKTGLPTWLALTAGYRLDLSDPVRLGSLAAEMAGLGVQRVLVNCVPAVAAGPFVEAIATIGVPFGIYANAGALDAGLGWGDPAGPRRYAAEARSWVAAGATVIGGCCGTSPAHIAMLRDGVIGSRS